MSRSTQFALSNLSSLLILATLAATLATAEDQKSSKAGKKAALKKGQDKKALAKKPDAKKPIRKTPGAADIGSRDKKGIEFFEKKIRPVLVKHCYECHSAESDEVEGELVLDTRKGILKGGASGHAIVPGNLGESLLIKSIRYEGDFDMPPETQLPESVIADFERWIKMGAPDPREGKAFSRKAIDFDAAREFWAFRPISGSVPPKVGDPAWPRNTIDRFILSGLEAKGLKPNADADPVVLVRRVYFDLTGLPPTTEQVDQFVADPSPAALKKLVDRLLETPQFGERWGRHWLDVVRYAESTGMERNFTFPYAWRYRDYVIKSFNEDKPFDRFITEQVAGDLLSTDDIEQRNENIIATGLLALGTKSLNERNKEKFLMDVVDEQIDVTTQAFLGTTASCARCHDHKFDPIPQSEYYSLAGVFTSTDTFYGTGNNRGNRQAGRLLALGPEGVSPASAAKGNAKGAQNGNRKALNKQLVAAQRKLTKLNEQAAKNPAIAKRAAAAKAQVKRLQTRLKRLGSAKPTVAKKSPGNAILVMAVQDSPRPADTAVRIRGEASDHGDMMPRGFLTIATPESAPTVDGKVSGRLQYAEWLTAKDNPLTARVAANRVWQHLFGRGIVVSVNNFGVTGTPPTHPELLDALARELTENNWSIKHLIRTVMVSRTYQLSSAVSKNSLEVDPDNNLFWRMNQRRLEVEAIRDSVLAVSGKLDMKPATGSVVQQVGNADIGTSVSPTRFAGANFKRSVYLPIVRGAVPEMLQAFDFPDPSIIYGQREVTTVPTQALFMMNSSFMLEQSREFANRLLAREGISDAERVEWAYRLALGRRPTSEQSSHVLKFIKQTMSADEDSGSADAEVNAWLPFCQTLFASSEFRYVN